MSDYRAVAGITGALQALLHGPASSAVPGAAVRTGPPTNGSLAGGPGLVNIFLYQVSPNAQFRNADLPTRRHDGSLIQRPQAALDLSYLISFFGEESKMVPQLLLGATVAALHAQPVLTPEDIPEQLYGRSLGDSGLAEQAHLAQFRAVPLSHEELSRIWSVFFQVPYALSVAYTCSVALIEADLTPEPAMPARELMFGAFPGGPPVIHRVLPATVEPGDGAGVRLEGHGLTTRGTVVRFGDLEVRPEATGDGALEVELPPTLRPGGQSVFAIRKPAGEGLAGHRGRSEPATFALLPKIAERIVVGQETLRVRSVSPVGRRQAAQLHLFERLGSGERRRRSASLRARPRSEEGHWLEFDRAGLDAGTYLAALEVDGFRSRLVTGPDPEEPGIETYVAPEVVLT